MKKFLGLVVCLSLVLNSLQTMAMPAEKIDIRVNVDGSVVAQQYDNLPIQQKIYLLRKDISKLNEKLRYIMFEAEARKLNLQTPGVSSRTVDNIAGIAAMTGLAGAATSAAVGVKFPKAGIRGLQISSIIVVISALYGFFGNMLAEAYPKRLKLFTDDALRIELEQTIQDITHKMIQEQELEKQLAK